jgi:hypothetical protein
MASCSDAFQAGSYNSSGYRRVSGRLKYWVVTGCQLATVSRKMEMIHLEYISQGL